MAHEDEAGQGLHGSASMLDEALGTTRTSSCSDDEA
jgi:hypothetical protein